jgi:O-antigen/teichoic acid export membrane protein
MTDSSHIKTTFKHTIIYGLSSIAEKAVGFIMLPFYTHLLGVEAYGILEMIQVVVSVLTVLVSYGVASAVNRFYFERKTEPERYLLISTASITMFLLTVAVCLPTLLLSKQIARLAFGVEGLAYYLNLALLVFFVDTTAIVGQVYILQKQKSVFFSLLSFARFFLGLILNIYLVLYLRLGILGILYSQLVTVSLYATFIDIYTLKFTGIHFKIEEAKTILKYSLPLLPGHVAMFIRSNTDRIILRTFMGLTELGVFGTVSKFTDLMGVFVHEPFMKIWIVKRMEIADTPEGPKTISRMFTQYLAVSLFFGLLLSLEIPLLIKVLTPEEFWVSGMIAFLAVTSRVVFHSYYHFLFGLLYGKATAKISGIQIVSAGTTVAANIVFIKYYGLLGAFMAALLVYGIQCISTYILAQKYYRIEYEWRRIVIMTTSALLLFFLIDCLSLKEFGWDAWMNKNVLPFFSVAFKAFHFDTIKGGRVWLLVNEKFPLVTEGIIKAILCLGFLPITVLLGVIPKMAAVEMWHEFFGKGRAQVKRQPKDKAANIQRARNF